MSLPINYFAAKPAFFKDRKIVPMVKENIVSCYIDEKNKWTLIEFVNKSSKSGKIYNLEIQLYTTDTIQSITEIKVNCNCASFLYQCKSLLYTRDAVYGPTEITKLPKKYNKPYVCKHLYAALVLLMRLNNVKLIKPSE